MENSKVQGILLSIINELLRHPITTSVRNLERSEKATIDLTEIKNKVAQNQYTSIPQMCNDIETVWKELEERSQDSQANIKISCECRRLLGKLRMRFDTSDVPQWCNSIYRVRSALTNLMTQPPEKVGQIIPSIGKARPTKINRTGMSERDVYNFLQAANMITKPEDHKGMIKIINEMQPEIETSSIDVNLNIDDINSATAEALRNFIRAALERDGLKYPE